MSTDASFDCVAADAVIGAGGVAATRATPIYPASLEGGIYDARVVSQPATPVGPAAPAPARPARTRSLASATVAAMPAAEDLGFGKTPAGSKRSPLNGDLVRRRWRSLIGRHPPKTLSHVLMDRILSWREQVAESGDVNSRSRAILAAALAGKTSGADPDGRGQANARDKDSGAQGPRSRAPLRVGTALIREHAGVLHRVMVVPDGFEWEGRTYASLSSVARAITGVRWNGHRFFALDRSAKRAAIPSGRERNGTSRQALRAPSEPAHAEEAT